MSTLHAPHHKKHDQGELFGRMEHFVLENRKSLITIGGAILALVLIFVWYQFSYIPGREKEAQSQMFRAEYYFANDSLSKAIDGDGSYPGFKQIVDEYSNTKSGNLAQYYLGISYLKTGKYEDAIEHLTSFSSSDALLATLALGATGDAHCELKNYDKAIVFYKKAVERKANEFTSPLYLKKLGLVYEATKDYPSALECYKAIENDYAESQEAKIIKVYVARAQAHIQ